MNRVRSLMLLAATCVGVWVLVGIEPGAAATPPHLAVHFLDVGQGDATLIETPDQVQMLIDGGPTGLVLQRLAEEMGFFDRTIDVVVATHPDSDHISGLVDVLERYQVDTIIMTENEHQTAVTDALAAAVDAEVAAGATLLYARAGDVVQLGASTTFTILFPDRDPTEWESNTSSIVGQLQYGDIGFMLTGDSPQAIEKYLVRRYGDTLESEVLKAGHHGSRTSSAELFVAAVAPKYAIISAGKDNRYGHPHQEVLDLLATYPLQLLETSIEGTVTLGTDGVHIWQE